MSNRKEFSVLKWVIFPLTSLLLASVVVWFNLRVFGYDDGLPYLGVVGLIAFFSIVICKYTNNPNRGLRLCAFVAEIFLTLALIINAAWSLSIQRNMSVAKQGEASRKAEMEEIRKLDRRAQRTAVKQMGDRKTAQDTFSEYEVILFWIMVGEMLLYGICAFSLFGLAQIVEEFEPIVETRAETREPVIKPTVKWQGNRIIETPPQRINGKDQDARSH